MYYIRAGRFEGNISKYRKQMAGGRGLQKNLKKVGGNGAHLVAAAVVVVATAAQW